MRARSAFELKVARGGMTPAFLAPPDRIDRVEVVDIDSGEVVLFWDLHAQPAARLARRLRVDLSELSAEEFLATWEPTQAPLGA